MKFRAPTCLVLALLLAMGCAGTRPVKAPADGYWTPVGKGHQGPKILRNCWPAYTLYAFTPREKHLLLESRQVYSGANRSEPRGWKVTLKKRTLRGEELQGPLWNHARNEDLELSYNRKRGTWCGHLGKRNLCLAPLELKPPKQGCGKPPP